MDRKSDGWSSGSDDTVPGNAGDTRPSETARMSTGASLEPPTASEGWFKQATPFGSEYFLRHPFQPGIGPPSTASSRASSYFHTTNTNRSPLHVPRDPSHGAPTLGSPYLLPGLTPPRPTSTIPRQSQWHTHISETGASTARNDAVTPTEGLSAPATPTTSVPKGKQRAPRRSYRPPEPSSAMQQAVVDYDFGRLTANVTRLAAQVSELEAQVKDLRERDQDTTKRQQLLENRLARYEAFLKTFLAFDPSDSAMSAAQQGSFQMQYSGVPLQQAHLDSALFGTPGLGGTNRPEEIQTRRSTN